MSLGAWLTVLQSAPPGAHSWSELLTSRRSIDETLALSQQELRSAGLGEKRIRRLRAPDRALMEEWRRWLEPPDRTLITCDSPAYPDLLRQIPDAPLALWAEGARMDLLKGAHLAMVGSRSPTASGRETAEQFARYLSDRGLTITSGLATGIDEASHTGALSGCAGTVAVLGSGLDSIFPRSNQGLAKQIVASGLIVSEYPPGTPALAAHFPQRNRIIAGLSVGTLVVEAARRSGSLITARLATEYGREVFAIPGSIHSPLARGCHRLIRDGAKLVEEAADVLVELAPLLQLTDIQATRSAEAPAVPSDFTEAPGYTELLEAVGFDPCTIPNLSQRTGLTTAELSSMLLLLELEGHVEVMPGGRYSRLSKRDP